MTATAVAADGATAQLLAELVADGHPITGELTTKGMGALIERIRVLNGTGPEMARVADHAIPGLAAEVRVRLLRPVPQPQGVILFVGLGGWVAGSPEASECVARKLAERTTCAVALVDVRRLPEHRYPAATDDVYAAACWLWRERATLGHDDLPHMILGEGMGAALSAVAAARARADPTGPRFALQFLICPVTDATAVDDPAQDTPLLSRAALERFWEAYVPVAERRADPDVSPLRIADCRGLPPTVLVTAELDPARAEGAAFAARLRNSGVAVAHRDFAGQIHGFFSILALPLGERALQHIVRAVRGYITRLHSGLAEVPADTDAWLNRIVK